jgi:T4 RnlA family RNA ligase
MFNFPEIRTIQQVLPAIEGYDEFVVMDKDGYQVIDYLYQEHGSAGNTFGDGETTHDLIRRECRGLCFEAKTGYLIRRPLNKFFNYGEKPETNNIVDNHKVIVQDKLDGSMISPIYLHTGTRLGTRKGITDVAMRAEKWVAENNPEIFTFIDSLKGRGLCPIFEFLDKDNPIVILHKESDLVLLAVRELYSGNYVSLNKVMVPSSISVVNETHYSDGIQDLIAKTKDLVNEEGYVVTLPETNYKFKVKGDWYVRLHRVMDCVNEPRRLVEAILKDGLDDVVPVLKQQPELWERVRIFEQELWSYIHTMCYALVDFFKDIETQGITKKQIGLGQFPSLSPFEKSVVFSLYDTPRVKGHHVKKEVTERIIKNLTKRQSYDKLIENGGLSERFKEI